jgi:glycogen(starch) synthase
VRVLHVLDHSIPLQSGYTFRTRAILRGQRALGWQTTHLTSPKHTAPGPAVEQVDGLEFHRTRWKPGSFRRWPAANELTQMHATSRRLLEMAREVRPDVMHVHSPVLNALPALWVGRRLKVPVVYEIRAFWEDAAVDLGTSRPAGSRYRVTRALETFAARHADHVTTICDGLKRDLVSRGIADTGITVIPNAVDVERLPFGVAPDLALKSQLGLQDCSVIGFIGSFYSYEGLDLLLAALPSILAVRPDVRILLAGGGPEEAKLRTLATALGIQDKIVFAGRVPNDDVQRYYGIADAMVYPRRAIRLTELVTPLKPLEAMALGRVVLASDVGGHRELIRDGDTGILFRAGDMAAIADAVITTLANFEQRAALRSRGRRFVEQERNWAKSVGGYCDVFERLVRR